jgi:hypothetical protein
MLRREVQEYLRVSAKLFGLAYEEGAVTPAERAAIVSFAQEVEKRFLPSRQQDEVSLPATVSDFPPTIPPPPH